MFCCVAAFERPLVAYSGTMLPVRRTVGGDKLWVATRRAVCVSCLFSLDLMDHNLRAACSLGSQIFNWLAVGGSDRRGPGAERCRPALPAPPGCRRFRSRDLVFARRVFGEQNQQWPRNSRPVFVFAAGVLMMVTTSCRIVFHLLPIGGDRNLAVLGLGARRRLAGRCGGARASPGAPWQRERRGGSAHLPAAPPARLFTEPQTSVLCQPAANY